MAELGGTRCTKGLGRCKRIKELAEAMNLTVCERYQVNEVCLVDVAGSSYAAFGVSDHRH